ncbi:DUF4113 domain-containing protein [Morganella morganii]|uniref:DUF4113 domain-containing protein n=1 Tax=Morganella morganii TaxID=582 RepID=UPI0032DA6F8C
MLLVTVTVFVGHCTLSCARFSGKGSDSGYKMKREILSPAYTTNFNQLPVVKS